MTASTRLVVLQRPVQPLEDICTRLAEWNFACTTTTAGSELMSVLGRRAADVVLLDAGSEDAPGVITAVTGDAQFRDLPVIVATAEEVEFVASQALALGASDVLAMPLEDGELYARVRALSRLAGMEAEVRWRERVFERFGVQPAPIRPGPRPPLLADRIGILLIGPAGPEQIQVMNALGRAVTVAYSETAEQALERLMHQTHDLALITGLRNVGQLERLCSSIRSDSGLFDLPIMLVGHSAHFPERALPYEWGVSDVLFHPFHPGVLRLRVQSWVHQQRLRRRLREVLTSSPLPPIVDSASRLFAHGFLHDYLDGLIGESLQSERPLALVALAVNGMTPINRQHGYATGDRVLRHIGRTLARTCRAEDLPARIGDDRFVIVVKNAGANEAQRVAGRIAGLVERSPFALGGNRRLAISLRSGVTELYRGDNATAMIERAFERLQPADLRRAS